MTFKSKTIHGNTHNSYESLVSCVRLEIEMLKKKGLSDVGTWTPKYLKI